MECDGQDVMWIVHDLPEMPLPKEPLPLPSLPGSKRDRSQGSYRAPTWICAHARSCSTSGTSHGDRPLEELGSRDDPHRVQRKGVRSIGERHLAPTTGSHQPTSNGQIIFSHVTCRSFTMQAQTTLWRPPLGILEGSVQISAANARPADPSKLCTHMVCGNHSHISLSTDRFSFWWSSMSHL